MKKLSFYHCVQLTEAGMPPLGAPPGGGAAPPGGDPMGGGMPGGDPMGGGMPPGGDPMGGGMPPMGGGMGGMGGDPSANQEPIPIKTISAADVWGVLKRIANDPKLETFFDEISVARSPTPKKSESKPQSKSLLR